MFTRTGASANACLVFPRKRLRAIFGVMRYSKHERTKETSRLVTERVANGAKLEDVRKDFGDISHGTFRKMYAREIARGKEKYAKSINPEAKTYVDVIQDKPVSKTSRALETRPNGIMSKVSVPGLVHQRTDIIAKMVLAQASAGVPMRAIVASTGISKSTIVKYYSEELEKGKASCEADLSKRVVDIAKGEVYDEDGKSIVTMRDSLAACRYYLGARFDWSDSNKTVKLTGPDGGPIQAVTVSMTPEQAAEAYAKTREATAKDITEFIEGQEA